MAQAVDINGGEDDTLNQKSPTCTQGTGRPLAIFVQENRGGCVVLHKCTTAAMCVHQLG